MLFHPLIEENFPHAFDERIQALVSQFTLVQRIFFLGIKVDWLTDNQEKFVGCALGVESQKGDNVQRVDRRLFGCGHLDLLIQFLPFGYYIYYSILFTLCQQVSLTFLSLERLQCFFTSLTRAEPLTCSQYLRNSSLLIFGGVCLFIFISLYLTIIVSQIATFVNNYFHQCSTLLMNLAHPLTSEILYYVSVSEILCLCIPNKKVDYSHPFISL